MAVVAISRRLTLSDVEMDRDLADFLAFMLSEDYWRDIPIEVPTTEWVTNYLAHHVKAAVAAPRRGFCVVARLRETGEFVGEGCVRPWDDISGDVGWAVLPRFRGQGFATEIGAAMLRAGFESLGLHRICALCKVGNMASRRVMEKLGMQREGTLREHCLAREERWSSWMFSLLSSDARP